MRRRRWDVGSRGATACAAVAVGALVLTACGQTRFTAPPEPEFTRGRPAESTLPATTTTQLPSVTVQESTTVALAGIEHVIEPDAASSSLPPIETAPTTLPPDLRDPDVASMVIVDDAGVAVPNISGWDAFDRNLQSRLIPADVSASVAVMLDGQMVHQAAFGERVLWSGEPVEVTDRFRIASISKTITMIVVMQLVESGQLTLDDPVGQVVLDYLGVAPSDPDAAGITVRQLLSHTAGFAVYQSTFFGNGAVSYPDAARVGMSGAVNAGAPYTYSNMNFVVLSVLIEAVTGQAYEHVVAERLLTPLGITDMRMTGTHDLGPDEVSHHPTAGRAYMEPLGGAGAWNATPTEVVTIYNSIDPATAGWKALSPASMDLIRQGVPTGSPASSYGLGIINYPGEAWGHTGTIEHAHSMVLVQPDGLTWAISVSGETPSSTQTLRGIMHSAFLAGFPG